MKPSNARSWAKVLYSGGPGSSGRPAGCVGTGGYVDAGEVGPQPAGRRQTRGERRHPEDRTLSVARAFEEENRVEVVVQKTPYARFDGNDSSVPHTRVERVVSVVASTDKIERR